MSFKKVKNEKEFKSFIKSFQKQRQLLKARLENEKIGEKELFDVAEKIQKPVIKAITESAHYGFDNAIKLLPIEHQTPALATTETATAVSQSQRVLQEFMSTSHRATSTLEVNLGNGKLGKVGKVHVSKLLNDDVIEFSHNKHTEIIPTTLGLLYLLLAPYKFIAANKLLTKTITPDDRIMYAQMIDQAGVEDTAKGSSEKYNKIVLPILKKQLQEGFGVLTQIPRNAYKLDLSTGKFGKLNINVPLLMTTLKLVAYIGKKKILEDTIDPDLIYLLTKRYNPKKRYSPKSVEVFTKLVELSELNPAMHSKKLNLLRGGEVSACSKQYYSSNDELVDRLSLLTASVDAGNTSVDVKNEISEILDILLKNKCLTQKEQQQIYKKFCY